MHLAPTLQPPGLWFLSGRGPTHPRRSLAKRWEPGSRKPRSGRPRSRCAPGRSMAKPRARTPAPRPRLAGSLRPWGILPRRGAGSCTGTLPATRGLQNHGVRNLSGPRSQQSEFPKVRATRSALLAAGSPRGDSGLAGAQPALRPWHLDGPGPGYRVARPVAICRGVRIR